MKKPIAILSIAVVLALDAFTAQAQKEQTIVVRILSKDDCSVAHATVRCSAVGQKLREIGIPPTTIVEFSADGYSGFDTLKAATASVARAGYKGRVSFSTEPK